MKTKLALFVLIIALAVFSIYKGENLATFYIRSSSYLVGLYNTATNGVLNIINEHFNQANEIRNLRERNLELEKSATLLSTFENELNEILKDKNASIYAPSVKLVRGLSYAQIGDFNKIWISEFSGFDKDKIYGLIYQGKSAGIVVAKDEKPLAYLQTDPNSIFAVYIGKDEKIPGIAHGNTNGILVKFIPQWLSLKVGDEVFTSGLDGIFFGGISVGRVSEIYKESLYQSALVEPYVKINIPSYLYVITKER